MCAIPAQADGRSGHIIVISIFYADERAYIERSCPWTASVGFCRRLRAIDMRDEDPRGWSLLRERGSSPPAMLFGGTVAASTGGKALTFEDRCGRISAPIKLDALLAFPATAPVPQERTHALWHSFPSMATTATRRDAWRPRGRQPPKGDAKPASHADRP